MAHELEREAMRMGYELEFWTNCLSKMQRKLVRVEGENQIEDWLMKAFGFWDEIKEVNDGLLVFGNYFLGAGTVGLVQARMFRLVLWASLFCGPT
ncbi:hypothetical protein Gogos_002115, partial [Gossypium gossypioides]|nr:hypothetical protein [Gossypium gossypioides]